jgi:hypothetical protein
MFNQEGVVDSLSSAEIDAAVKRVDELKALALAKCELAEKIS